MTTQLELLPQPVTIPDPEDVRRRLAALLTETAVLRSQLRVSTRLERERERMRRQVDACEEKAVAR